MRDIEIRGQAIEDTDYVNINKGDWLYGKLIISGGYFFIVPDKCSFQETTENSMGNFYLISKKYFEVIPESVGEFTGLLDRNGVKIFEGDIIRVIGQSQEINVVAYDEGTFSVGTYEKTDAYPDGVFFTMWYLHIALNDEGAEVIGNIFDNGGLLDDC